MFEMVDGTGIIGVDMICPLGVSAPQPPNYDRVELEGAGMLVLPNSLDAPLEGLELGGKTEQVQTTGANLFDEKLLLDFDSENYDKTQSGSGFYYYKFPVNGTVTASTKNANKNGEYLTVGIKPDGSDKTWLSHGSAAISKYKTLTPEDGNIYLGVNNNLERVKSMIQNAGGIIINEGSVAKPYEPYTGGKPSPSPEYPQEIINAGKYNKDTGKYEVDIKITGKNLWNSKAEPDVKSVYAGWAINEGDRDLTLSIIDKKPEISIPSGLCVGFTSVGSSSAGNGVIWLIENGVLKTNGYITSNKKFVSIFPSSKDTIDLVNSRYDMMVEYGKNPTDYAPYAEQSLILTSDRPITKWDRLVEQGGQIGWLYQSAINEYRGDTVIAIYGTGFYFLLNNKKLKSGEGYCEELKQHVPSDEKPCISFNMSPNTYAYTLNTQAIYGSTVSAIKEYLKTHPLHLVYKTETTEFIPLQQSEQNAIRALKTYYPTTVITADGGELDPDIKVTYRKEI